MIPLNTNTGIFLQWIVTVDGNKNIDVSKSFIIKVVSK